MQTLFRVKCVRSTLQVLRSAHVLYRPTFTVNVCTNSMRGPAFPPLMAQFNSPVLSGSPSSSAVCHITCANFTLYGHARASSRSFSSDCSISLLEILKRFAIYRRLNFTLLLQLDKAVDLICANLCTCIYEYNIT